MVLMRKCLKPEKFNIFAYGPFKVIPNEKPDSEEVDESTSKEIKIFSP